MLNKQFCEWQEKGIERTTISNFICIFRKIEKEEFSNAEKTDIFCPYLTEKDAMAKCPEYQVTQRTKNER